MSTSEKISPTAYATGYLWYRHGLSHPGLVTPRGKRLDRAFRVLIGATRALSGVSLDDMLLARHKGIDALLTRAIDEGRVSQVIEIAAGLSARGYRFMKRYGDRLTYLETDLPAMAATKRKLLTDAGLISARHRVVELDALKDTGADSLAGIAATLDPKAGIAVVTEGLLSYLDPATADGVWRRIATNLRRFPHGLYLCDGYLTTEHRSAGVLLFGSVLSAFVRRRMHVHFDSAPHAAQRLKALSFASATLHQTHSLPETQELARTKGGARVQILEART